MIHLKNHFEFLHKLAEDRALKVINTVIDGEGGRANRMDTDTDDQPHRRRWVAVALGDGGSVGNALHSLDWMSRSSLGPLAQTHVANSLASVNCTE